MFEHLSKAVTILSSPTRAKRAAQFAARITLDIDFESRSPIPLLPQDFVDRISVTSVSLPSQGLLEPGNQSIKGLLSLIELARFNNSTTIFEIGTYNGITALTFAKNLPYATVHTLDLPNDGSPSLPLEQFDAVHIWPRFKRAFTGLPEELRILQHLGDSATFDFSEFHRRCDLVYVDGAHSLEYVSTDTETAFQLVSNRGIIVWDDYWRNVPDVARFLDSLSANHLYRIPDTRLVVWMSDSLIQQFNDNKG